MASENSYYQTLTRKLVLTVIIVSLTPLVLVSGIILGQFHISYHEKVHAHLGEIVQKHKQNIDTFLDEKLSDIRFLATSYSFPELSSDSVLKGVLSRLQRDHGPVFQDLGVVDDQGIQRAYAGPFKLEHAHYSEAEWFRKALQSNYYISDVFLGLRGLPHFIVAVRQKHEGRYWILRCTIDFVAFNSLVENLRIGQTGFAFILNHKGEFQTKPLFNAEPSARHYKDFLRTGLEHKDKVSIAEHYDDTGQKKVYVNAFLKGGEWLLIYQQDTNEAFADLRRAQGTAIAIVLLGGIGIITMARVLSGRMVRLIIQADQEKEVMNKQVIESGKLASIGELAAGIAHEINNPVAIMVEEAGWMEDLLAEEDLRETDNLVEYRRALAQIKNQGKRCKEITHKLLSFARKTDTPTHDVQLNELIEEVVELARQRARYSNVLIRTNLQQDLPTVKVSAMEIEQVLLNLINNALDAMDKKGGTIDIDSYREYNFIIIDVADSGPGIPQANLEKIFDPFFTTKPVGKGTGLGLSICFGIIHKMGGLINVQSVIGVGTTFRVKIPLQDKNANQSKREQSARFIGAAGR